MRKNVEKKEKVLNVEKNNDIINNFNNTIDNIMLCIDEEENIENNRIKNKHIVNKLFNISIRLMNILKERNIENIEMYKFNKYLNKIYNSENNKNIVIEFSTYYYLYNKSKYRDFYKIVDIHDIKYISIILK